MTVMLEFSRLRPEHRHTLKETLGASQLINEQTI
jgi:hypothetical protein